MSFLKIFFSTVFYPIYVVSKIIILLIQLNSLSTKNNTAKLFYGNFQGTIEKKALLLPKVCYAFMDNCKKNYD